MSAPIEAEDRLLQAVDGLRERMAEDMRPELLEAAQKVLPVLGRAIDGSSDASPHLLSMARLIQSQLQEAVENPEAFADSLILALILSVEVTVDQLRKADSPTDRQELEG